MESEDGDGQGKVECKDDGVEWDVRAVHCVQADEPTAHIRRNRQKQAFLIRAETLGVSIDQPKGSPAFRPYVAAIEKGEKRSPSVKSP